MRVLHIRLKPAIFLYFGSLLDKPALVMSFACLQITPAFFNAMQAHMSPCTAVSSLLLLGIVATAICEGILFPA